MPEEVIIAVGEYLGEQAATAEIGSFLIEYAGAISTISAIASVYTLRDQQRRAENRAKDAANASLRDRYAMVRGAIEQRQIVLGRARVSGPLMFVGSYGTKREHLIFAVALAGHEIDAVEAIYFDDEQVALDADPATASPGTTLNVIGINRREDFSISTASASFTLTSAPAAGTVSATAYYGTDVVPLTVGSISGSTVPVSGARSGQTGKLTVTYQPAPNPYAPSNPTAAADTFVGTGALQTVTLSHTPSAGTINVIDRQGTGDGTIDASIGFTTSGNTVTFTTLAAGDPVTVNYQYSNTKSNARIRCYRGTSTQTADAGLISAFPSMWTSAHKATGIAYLVIELDYDQNAFPGGIPNVSAKIRGDNQCLDPRTGLRSWTDNCALLTRRYAEHPLGAAMTAAQINDAMVIAASNVCDTVTPYVVGSNTYSRALYKGGSVFKADTRASDCLNELTQAMGGRWVFGDGVLRIKPGTYTSPVASLDESWLSSGNAVELQPHRNRPDVINTATATFADEEQDYQELRIPRIDATAYITEDGKALPSDMRLAGVQWTGQAQYIGSCAIRYARQGLTVKLTCNLKAYPLEVFDVVSVSIARYGWVSKAFEVLDSSWTLDGGIELTLKEIDPSIWQIDAGFPAQDPAPNTRLPNPFGVPKISGLSAASGTAQLLKQADGTIVSRILASWTLISEASVNAAGQIEVRYGKASVAPSGWTSIFVPGDATQAYLDNVLDGGLYLIMVRGLAPLATGDWSAPVLHQVIGKTALPVNVAGFAVTPLPAACSSRGPKTPRPTTR
jgi:hypothetical protein